MNGLGLKVRVDAIGDSQEKCLEDLRLQPGKRDRDGMMVARRCEDDFCRAVVVMVDVIDLRTAEHRAVRGG